MLAQAIESFSFKGFRKEQKGTPYDHTNPVCHKLKYMKGKILKFLLMTQVDVSELQVSKTRGAIVKGRGEPKFWKCDHSNGLGLKITKSY